MPAPTLAQRERILRRYGRTYFACPTNLDYPLDSKARISSAKAYYPRKGTVKCKGGRVRICRRAKKVGFLKQDYSGYRGWKTFCRGVG